MTRTGTITRSVLGIIGFIFLLLSVILCLGCNCRVGLCGRRSARFQRGYTDRLDLLAYCAGAAAWRHHFAQGFDPTTALTASNSYV